jgi:hypothetical protein
MHYSDAESEGFLYFLKKIYLGVRAKPIFHLRKYHHDLIGDAALLL